MMHELRLFFVALMFLTRVPVPAWVGHDPAWMQTCTRYFPLVGAFVGAWGAGVLWLTLLVWPPPVAAVLSIAATVWLTGGFHEDGLADTCDALGGAVSRERALAIMKDSRIGSYGALALILVLGLKVMIISALSLTPITAMAALVWSHTASRAASVALMHALPYAGDIEHAKARPLAIGIHMREPCVAFGLVLLASAAIVVTVAPAAGWVVPLAMSAAFFASVAMMLWCVRWLQRRLGGYTGDTLGATQQLVEAAGLLAWLAVAHTGIQ